MVAFGGSAPIRAVRVARKLKIPRVVVPMGAGVFSAFGLLVSPMSFDALRTRRIALADLSPTRFADEFRAPTAEALGFLAQAGVKESGIRLTRRLDMRYQGQGFEIDRDRAADDPAHAGEVPAREPEAGRRGHNDPWIGTGHLFDVCVMRPVFRGPRLVGYAMSITHLPDIGGLGWSMTSSEICEEGLRLPVCKIVKAGHLNEELMELVRANVRTPDMTAGDLMANVYSVDGNSFTESMNSRLDGARMRHPVEGAASVRPECCPRSS